MRVGYDNSLLPAASVGAAAKSPSHEPRGFASSLLDLTRSDGPSEASAWSSGRRDPVHAANEALAREFLEWAQKTPEEKIRERILQAKGLDEESFRDLPKAEQDAIEDEIRAAVLRAFGLDAANDAPQAPRAATAAL